MNKRRIFSLFSNLTIFLKNKKENEVNILKSAWSAKQKGVYIGWVGHNNLGDEILHQAHLNLFSHFDILPYESNSLIEKSLMLINKNVYDFGILGGGTLINQNHRWLKETKELQKKRIPLFCIGTGVASKDFWDNQHDEQWNDDISSWVNILSSFLFVGVRGPISKNILNNNGLNNVKVVGDTALSLAPDTYVKRKFSRVIGINFGIVKGNPMLGKPDEFIKQMIILIKYLISRNYKVILLPVWKDDIPSNLKVQKEFDSKKCMLINCGTDMESYADHLKKCDIFIGQKLHSVVLASMFRIPSLMIEYDPKCRDFMASLDLEEYLLRITEFKLDIVKSYIDKLLINKEEIQNKLDEKVLMYKRIQKKYAKDISEKLKSDIY